MPRRRYVPPTQLKNEKAHASGYASLDSTGLVPSTQLPVTGGGVPSSRTISTTAPLQGGGDLSANRTLSINFPGGTTDFLRADGTFATPAGGGGAPTTVDYLVKTADAGLSAERVVTDTASVAVDWATAGQAKFNVQFGSSGTTAAVGNDSRLSDARTPTSHVIATNVALGAQHTISGASAGQVLRASSATAANFQALAAGDLPNLPESQITNLTTDLSAKEAIANKGAVSGYASLDASTKVPIAQIPTGTTGTTVPFGNDARFTDSRTPLAHATSHKSGGSDAIKLDELAAPTDITTLNASTAAHGLMMKYPGGTSNFLRADGSFAAPTAALALTTTEVSLVSAPDARRSGKVQITGLSGLTTGKAVLIQQAVGPYTGKGTRADETEMDQLDLSAIVLNATTIDVFWASRYQVRGNYKLNYLVSA